MRRSLSLALRPRINCALVAVCIGAIFQPATALANGSGSSIALGVNPAIIEVGVRPGQTITRGLAVSNQTDFSLPVTTKIESLINTNEIINPKLKQQYDGSTWVKVEPAALVMAKHQIKEIPVTIAVPKDATPGGHYAQMSVRGLTLEDNTSANGNTTVVVPEITVSVLMTVGGYINERLEFQKNRIFGHLDELNADKLIDFNVENRGNVHALVIPELVIEKNGREYSRTRLTSKVVLPNSIKVFQETWRTPATGGVYTAHIEFRHGNPLQTTVSQKERVLVMPPLWQVFLAAVAALLARYLLLHRKNVRAALNVLFGQS